MSARFSREKRVAEDLEQPRLALPASAPEGVDRGADFDLNETAFFQYLLPACARQATGNSIGPQVDVADSRLWHGPAGGDVSELQSSPRAQHPHDLI